MEKLADFAGFSRDFRGIFAGKKSKFAEKSADFAGYIRGRKSKFAEKLADFTGFSAKKSNFEGFSGASS